MKTLKKIFAALTVIAIVAMAGCKKDNNAEGYMAVKMSESRTTSGSTPADPGDPLIFSSVNLDIASVEVHYANEAEGQSGWITLNTQAGIYDMLTLQNDVTATIAGDTKLPVGKITQLRLILGPNNSVVISGGIAHTLKVPSTEVKINVGSSVPADAHLEVTLDFDADKSIVVEGKGEFTLKPVIQVKSVTIIN